jgi:hypothetical protein
MHAPAPLISKLDLQRRRLPRYSHRIHSRQTTRIASDQWRSNSLSKDVLSSQMKIIWPGG